MKKLMAVFVLLLASALVFSLAAFSIDAAAAGELTVTGGTSGTDYDYSGDVLTIKRSTPITISGTTNTDRIVVDSTSGANITLSGVNVTSSTGAAFEIAESAKGTVTVTLEGSNRLTSGGNSAGLQKNGESCELLINGAGGLTATSGTGGAGIGGAQGKSSGKIEIYTSSTKIKLVTGGTGGAGIGGGKNGNGSNITITHGVIEVGDHDGAYGNGGMVSNGSVDGAGIGGGEGGSGSYITITDGVFGIFTNGGGAGIGGGKGGEGSNIEITGGNLAYVQGGTGAGIGGGDGADGHNITISGGVILPHSSNGAAIGGGRFGDGKFITISGSASVTATKGIGDGAAIGGGQGGNGDVIKIEGNAGVTASGGTNSAGIGGGSRFDKGNGKFIGGNGSNITINTTQYVTATGYGYGAGIGGGDNGSGSNITIKNGTVVATGGEGALSNGGAGIGGGRNCSGSNITIEGGSVTAISKHDGAGIGGGADYATYYGREPDPTGRGITISGGTVKVNVEGNGAGIGGGMRGAGGADGKGNGITISGGEVTVEVKGTGAGIGGGLDGDGTNITISGGTVKVTSTSGAGIGGGNSPNSNSGNGSSITITGGDVTATSTATGAGIGGGLGGSGNDITISGGKVKATGSGGAGIGGGVFTGFGGTGENIEISGTAEVTARSSGGAGIGGGNNGTGRDITISNGMVTATSTGGAGIGAGAAGNGAAGNIKISGGTVFALGNGIGIGGQNSDATVYIKGVSGTKYPWVFTNKITSSNYAGRYGTGNDGYLGIVFENASGNSFTDKENNNFNEGIVYGTSKTVEIMEDYTLKTGKTLTVPAKVTFATKDMFTLDSSILYLKEEATLDKWYKMEIKGSGEIQHEDSSDYKWYGAEKYEFINATNYTELYSLNGSEGIVLCDICGEPEPHAAHINDKWEITSTHHWKLGTCDLGDDCAVTPFTSGVEKCSYMTAGNQLYYGLHRFGEPTKEADGLWHYICIDCLYEKTASDPITPTPKPTPTPSTRTGIIKIYKVDYADGSPLEGAKFGLYSDEECTSLIKSAVSEMDDDKAVVYFKVSAGDTYYVKEISAPNGYRLSGKVFKAKVSSNGTVTYSVVGTAGTSEDIPVCANVKATGNPGTAAGIGVAGIAAMSGTVCIVSLAKKGRKKQP